LAVFAYGPWFFWIRYHLALGSHATEGLDVSRLGEISTRVAPAAEQALQVWMDFQQWGLSLIILLVGGFISLWRFKKHSLLVCFPLIYLAGLFFVVVAHTADVGWQVGTAWDRLTLQAISLFAVAIPAALVGFDNNTN
jgi:hypothetical protein